MTSTSLTLALNHGDLHLLQDQWAEPELAGEQGGHPYAPLNGRVSIVECVYLLVCEYGIDRQTRGLRKSREDYRREWCPRRDFRDALPDLLMGGTTTSLLTSE